MDHAAAPPSSMGRLGLVATLWTALVVAPFAGLADPAWWLATAAVAVFVAGAAFRSARWPLGHAGLVAALVMVIAGWGVAGPWPLPLVVALALYAAIIRAVPSLRTSVDWVHWQTKPADAATRVLFVATLVLSVVALVLYAWLVQPDVAATAGDLEDLPAWTIPLVGLAFVIVNPAVEEALYRGALYRALEAETGSVGVAIVAQAMAFGALHVAGFPGGGIGIVLAGGWGTVLGVFRAHTGGLRWSWWAHVATNIVIFSAVQLLAADQGVL